MECDTTCERASHDNHCLLGSGLALLSIATLISDFITLFILPDRKFYNRVKYEQVEVPKNKQERKEFLRRTEDDDSRLESSPLLVDSVRFEP